MKKFLFTLILIALIIGGYTQDQFSWAKKLLLGEPTTHTVQKGEYLSKISQQYYGDATYWKELALVNRAPNSNLVFPGEQIVIPDQEAIKKLRAARSLSSVNKIVDHQEKVLAQRGIQTPTEELAQGKATGQQVTASNPQPMSEKAPAETGTSEALATVEPAESSSLPVILIVIGGLVAVALVVLYFYKKKKRAEEQSLIEERDVIFADDDEDYELEESERYQKSRQREIPVN
ncbi:MAG: LysM peptidoglycan-binding domain-containing protein [candidate division KSB1 bacterium]|nr:LysM peptidoglycan-binding domain-containing protein [candidate division KSB1 bacterium]